MAKTLNRTGLGEIVDRIGELEAHAKALVEEAEGLRDTLKGRASAGDVIEGTVFRAKFFDTAVKEISTKAVYNALGKDVKKLIEVVKVVKKNLGTYLNKEQIDKCEEVVGTRETLRIEPKAVTETAAETTETKAVVGRKLVVETK